MGHAERSERLWDRHVFLYAAIAALIWGSTHLYGVTRLMPSHDSLTEFFAGAGTKGPYTGLTWKIALGRFVTPVYEKLFRGTVSAPWLIGLLAMLFLLLAVFVTARILGLRRGLPILLLAGIMVCNPAVFTTAATYFHDLDCDMLALLLAALAAWCWRQGTLPDAAGGVLCLALCMGIYPSYLSVAVVLMMLVSILRLLEGDDPGHVVVRGLAGIGMTQAGLLLYAVLAAGVCRLSGVPLAQGGYNSVLNATSESTWSNMGSHLLACYAQVWDALTRELFGHDEAIGIVPAAALCALLAMLCLRMARGRIGAASAALIVLLIALMPVGMNLAMLGNNGETHDLMKYAIVLAYLPAPIWLEAALAGTPRAERMGAMILAGCVALVSWQYAVQANQIYLKKEMEERYTYSLMTRMLTRIEQTEGYRKDQTPILIAGNVGTLVKERRELLRYQTYTGQEAASPISFKKHYQLYIEYMLGTDAYYCDSETAKRILATPEAREMGIYPSADSIRMIDGVLVVKVAPIS